MSAGAVSRQLSFGALVVLATCAPPEPAPTPRIVAVLPNVVIEGSSVQVRVMAEGLGSLPSFDIDRGLGGEETASVVLGEHVRTLPALRAGAGVFTTDLPADLPAGRYGVTLRMNDGRSATLAEGLRVTSASLSVARVWSDQLYVAPGSSGLDVFVLVRNRGPCPLRNLAVVLRFERDGVDRVGAEFIARETQAPMTLASGAEAMATFLVEALPVAAFGEVSLDAYAVAERYGSDACQGSANAPFADEPGRWILTTSTIDDLEVVDLAASPSEVPRMNPHTNISLRVINRGAMRVHLDSIGLESMPPGVLTANQPQLDPRDLGPGEDAVFRVSAALPLAPGPATSFEVRAAVSGHDDTGAPHTSRQLASPVNVSVSSR